jgi:hypothetical protein
MKANIFPILNDAIESGTRTALMNSDRINIEDVDEVTHHVTREIWLLIDTYFTFDETP